MSSLLLAVVLPPLGFALVMIVLSRAYVGRRPSVRAALVRNKLWKLQFILHPILMLLMISVVSAALQKASSPFTIIAQCALVVVSFNFGVEPFDIPQDKIFLCFFYLHHLAPSLVAASLALATPFSSSWSSSAGATGSGGAGGAILIAAALPSAMVVGHAWALHPISYVHQKRWIDKHRWFGPYVISGCALHYNWWLSLCQHAYPATVASFVILAVLSQYVGRWGLYLRACQLYGWQRQCHPNHDPFEWNKQCAESVGLVATAILASLTVFGGAVG